MKNTKIAKMGNNVKEGVLKVAAVPVGIWAIKEMFLKDDGETVEEMMERVRAN